jgi:hypothetical protein
MLMGNLEVAGKWHALKVYTVEVTSSYSMQYRSFRLQERGLKERQIAGMPWKGLRCGREVMSLQVTGLDERLVAGAARFMEGPQVRQGHHASTYMYI